MEEKIKQLISELTLEEKAGLCSGLDFWHTKGVERLSIPPIMVSDGPHGLRKQRDDAGAANFHESIDAVCFPAACATAASFDEELLERLGGALGEECRAENVAVLLGPAVNIKRSPLCGRNFEYFSEDPCLAGKLAAAQVKGVQRWDVGTSVKHFAANNQEYHRMSCSSELSERTLREIYLRAFETVVREARPWTMMSSYNRINGVFASENRHLLTEILRGEWGFDGFVMSDWGAVNDRVNGLIAGLDLEMPSSGGINDQKLVSAVRDGKLPEEILDKAVERILDIVMRYTGHSHSEAVFDRAKHHALAADLEKECAVLLKNDGLLPLDRGNKIAYIGGFAKKPRYQGGGSSHIHTLNVSSALECAGDNVIYAEGFDTDTGEISDEGLELAVKAAAEAQSAVIFAGLPDSFESEGYDRRSMSLPDGQNRLIEEVLKVQKNTVVVLHCGSPVEIPWADSAAAILLMYLGGEGTGEAADALLYGEACPCGRLPETWPLKLEDNPSFLNFPGDKEKVDYAEGVFVGYRYYDAKKMPVRYPFGHGLSYTEFTYSNPRLSSALLEDGAAVTASIDVTNRGNRQGKEAVQLYVSDHTGTVRRPVKELKDFKKVSLAPGETKTVSFTIAAGSLSYYDEELMDWYASSGSYELLFAHSSRDVRARADLSFETKRELPFRVDANTTIGRLYADPRTAKILKSYLSAGSSIFGGSDGDNGGGAISAEAARQMIINSPLRSAQSFCHLSDETFSKLIDELNRQLGNAD